MSFFARPLSWQALRKTGLVLTLAGASAVAASAAGSVQAGEPPPEAAGSSLAAAVSIQQLPAEAQATQQLILAGGPFASRRDGSVFGNRERALPRRPRGFYHEYTVRTPGARDRGAKRIVCGGSPPTAPEACFYTADHYSTFHRIVR